MSIEVAAGVGLGPVAFQAESGDRRDGLAAGAKQNFLPGLRKPAAKGDPAGGNDPGSFGLCWERHHRVRIAEVLSIIYIIISGLCCLSALFAPLLTEPRHFVCIVH